MTRRSSAVPVRRPGPPVRGAAARRRRQRVATLVLALLAPAVGLLSDAHASRATPSPDAHTSRAVAPPAPASSRAGPPTADTNPAAPRLRPHVTSTGPLSGPEVSPARSRWSSPTQRVRDAAARAGVWRWPLPGRPEVVRAFDPPESPYGAGHRGVDLAAAPGTAVFAAGAGVVAYSGVLAGRGVLSIQHAAGLRTTYEPVQEAVPAGLRVVAGAVVARLAPGHPGCPRAACLHWGLRRQDTYLDPLALLGRGPIRLLPRAGVGDRSAGPVTGPHGRAERGATAGAGRSAGEGASRRGPDGAPSDSVPAPPADPASGGTGIPLPGSAAGSAGRAGRTDPARGPSPPTPITTVAAAGVAAAGALLLARRRPP